MIVVCLHNVVAGEADAFDRKCSRISAAELDAFLDRTAARRRLISFSEASALLDAGRDDERAVALSFDDGFLGVARHALPLLRRRGLDAAAFLNPPFVSDPAGTLFHFLEIELAFRLSARGALDLDALGGRLPLSTEKERVAAMKTTKRRLKLLPEAERASAHPRLLEALGVAPADLRAAAAADERYRTMGRKDALSLRAAGWTLGSHGLTHRTLGKLPAAQAREEIVGSKAGLESLLGGEAADFAYPYGEDAHVGDAAPELCRAARYRRAFTTVPGHIRPGDDPFRLKRVDYKEFIRERLS